MFDALPLKASTNKVVKTPLPSFSDAYWSEVEAVKIVIPSDINALSLIFGALPAMPE